MLREERIQYQDTQKRTFALYTLFIAEAPQAAVICNLLMNLLLSEESRGKLSISLARLYADLADQPSAA